MKIAATLLISTSLCSLGFVNAHAQGAMPGMSMPNSESVTPQTKKQKRKTTQTAPSKSASSKMSGMNMPGMKMEGMTTPGTSMPGMTKPNASSGAAQIPHGPPPPVPTDHAADYYYDPTQMAAARRGLREEQGETIFSKVLFDIAEFQLGQPGGYRWDTQAWVGGDINRVVIKSQGEGSGREGLDSAEIQLLYSRAVAPYTDIQAGIRYDFKPNPSRTYFTVGVQQLFPYWFDFEAALFVSNKGELLGRVEGYYDLLLTQRLVLQPRVELNFAAQNSADIGVGSGLSNAELGLRLRYELRREFAPYIGISYNQLVGNSAGYAKTSGKEAGSGKFVVGLRAWF